MLAERVRTYSLGNDNWLPQVDHEAPVITAFNFIFEASGETEVVPPPSIFASSQSSSGSSSDFAWFAGNLEALRKKYGTRWILIKDNNVLAASDDPVQLELIAEQQGIASPYITKIPVASTVWRTAYIYP